VRKIKWPAALVSVLIAIFAGVLVAGCGSSSSSSESSTTASTAETTTPETTAEEPAGESTGNGGEGSSEFKIVPLATLYSGSPTEGKPPTSGPPPAKDADVWWVSCGLVAEPCSIPAHGAEEAAKKLGWSFHIADGKLNENGGYLAAVRTAIAAEPTAIVIHGFNCPLVKSALEEAKSRNIVVMGVESSDCSELGGPQLYTEEMKYGQDAATAEEYFHSWGNRAASYLIAKTEEGAELINQEGTEEGLSTLVSEAFADTMELCSSCQILESIKFQDADFGPNGPLAQAFRSSLVKNPEANSVFAPYGSNVTDSETVKAIANAGLTEKMTSCCGSGEPAVIELVRNGELTATIAHSAEYMGWAAMDNLNRVLNEVETVPEGVELVIIDKEHNLPEPGNEIEISNPWKQEYEQLWKTGK
jgi:ribose transport system substrate-binding protein